MVLLTPSPALISALREYNSLPPEEPIPSDPFPPYLHHRTISKISTALIAHARNPKNAALYTLNHLLKECTVYIPPKPPKPEPVSLSSSSAPFPILPPLFFSPGAHTRFLRITHVPSTTAPNIFLLTSVPKSSRPMNTDPSWRAFGCRLKLLVTGVC